MINRPRLETRIGALISAYADHAPIDLDPAAITRVAVADSGRRWSIARVVARPERGLAILLLAVAVMIAMAAGALVAGDRSFQRDPEELLNRPTTVIGHYAEIHEGYVFVYADGRVVLYPDLRSTVPGSRLYSLNERRMTQDGIDLVRSGALRANRFLHTGQMPEFLWADSESKLYKPSRYAICYQRDGRLEDPSRVMDLLPAQVRTVLLGKERTYDETGQLGESPTVACSEVTAEQARLLVDLLEGAGLDADSNGPQPDFLDAGSDGGGFWAHARLETAPEEDPDGLDRMPELWFQPILPHGTWVGWGG